MGYLDKTESHEVESMLNDEFVAMVKQLKSNNDKIHATPRFTEELYNYGLYISEDRLQVVTVNAECVALARTFDDSEPTTQPAKRRNHLVPHLSSFFPSEDTSITQTSDRVVNYKAAGALSKYLYNYGISLYRAGRSKEAFENQAESLQIIRQLDECVPEAWEPELSQCLREYGFYLTQKCINGEECNVEAHNATAESLEIARRLYERDPNAFTSYLADSLHVLGMSLYVASKYDEACKTVLESIQITRRLHDRDPETYAPDLADRLRNYGLSFRELGRIEEACECGVKSLKTVKQLYERNPKAYESDLADRPQDYGSLLQMAGRYDEANKLRGESVQVIRGLYERNPDAYASNLAEYLRKYGISLRSR